MQQLLSSLEAERQRQFRRFVGISTAFHLALGLLFWVGPIRHSGKALPAVVRVDLVTVAATAPAAKPTPAPPAPPKPPPPKAQKVLPKQPAPLAKPKPPEAKPKPPEAKPKAEPAPKPEPKPPEPMPEQKLEDVLAQLRDEAGETSPNPMQEQAPPGGGPSGPGILVSPEVARWMRDAKMHVTRAWILAPGFRMEPLETKLAVELGPTGEVRSIRITQRSGNPWFDESVERAIQKASPLPPPPEAAEWPFSFSPEDVL